MSKYGIVTPNKSGEYLKALRIERCETQAKAAHGIGIGMSTLSRLEREGIRSSTRAVSVLFRVCDYYSISCDELLALSMQPA